MTLLSRGSPGTICQWSNTLRQKAWPCVWYLRGGRGSQEKGHERGVKKVMAQAASSAREGVRGVSGGDVPQVGLKTKALDDRQEGLDHKDGRPWPRDVGGDVSSALGQHVVYGGNAVGGRLDLDIVDWEEVGGGGIKHH